MPDMSSEESPYQYEKLESDGHIRLLTILRGRPGDSLQCQISQRCLSDQPSYEALSYVWGPQDSQYTLCCQGDVLQIGANLYEALCRLRRANRERILWVDKICICQDDTDERGSQVSLMSLIYSTAGSVIVWLGKGRGGDVRAFELLDRIDKVLCKQPAGNALLPASSQDGVKIYPTSEELIALNAVLNNSWFTRAWTFQEAVFAKCALVVCGPCSIAWVTLAHCIRWILSTDTVSAKDSEHISVMSSIAKFILDITETRALHASAHELLVLRRFADATDARDKVFALINTSSDKVEITRHRHYSWANQLDFIFHEPNYHMSVEEVYIATARHAITVEKNLDILLNVEAPKSDPTLPSWVPDWREPLGRPHFQPNKFGERRKFNATLDNKLELQDHDPTQPLAEHEGRIIVNEPRKLTLKGIRKVKITTVGERCPAPESPQFSAVVGHQGSWASMARRCSMKGVYTPTGEKVEFAFTCTKLCCPSQPNKTVQSAKKPSKLTGPGMMSSENPHEVYSNCAHRKFFTTTDGYFGLGPVTTRVGDVIYILFGGDVPFILRPTTADAMTFVGEAYVHGLMNGEGPQKAWKQYNKNKRVSEAHEWVTLV
jgi:Heterokaryon incompatibility protein (HET)